MPLTIEAGVKTKVATAVGVADAIDVGLENRDILVLILLELIRQTEAGRGNQETGSTTLKDRLDEAKDILDATK